MTVVTLRRISSSFPPALEKELHDLLRQKPLQPSKPVEMDNLIDKIFATGIIEKAKAVPPKKPARKSPIRKTTSEPATTDSKTTPRKKKEVEKDAENK